MILGKVQDLPKGLERENIIIQTILRQLLFALIVFTQQGLFIEILSHRILFYLKVIAACLQLIDPTF